ncbi:hypothetical protein [Serinicoccus kebangsaanensis]|uniref:hypothetical protein n=1 Tax=Serinicoccus kebangsaanensis TaxID=2602069 RepID=UPI00124E30F2|nr:hypothetical protein [Serinicoccus kebangsaanensis]
MPDDVLDLANHASLPVAVPVVEALQRRADSQGVSMVMIGAAARDIVVHAPLQQHSTRSTKDIDIAVGVSSDGYRRFTAGLLPLGGGGHKFVVDGAEVDVVPFGDVERDRQVHLGDGFRLDVNGVAEARATAVRVRLAPHLVVAVASLPAQAALKVLAWRDRQFDNPKDAQDLHEILTAAGQLPHSEATWAEGELLRRWDYDIALASACHVGLLAARPFAVRDGTRLLEVLDEEESIERLVRRMGGLASQDLLRAFTAGFREALLTRD